MNYRKINNLTGWITGAIAYVVYLLTMEPTVSFWDCGEFLSCAYKVEVGHSPGAPFFMLMQRLFGMFAGGGAMTGAPSAKVAAFINSFSALTSGLTILFLFWTITHLAKKLMTSGSDEEPDSKQTFLIMGAGLVGALAYTFSDTFWFSAVEAEVYATSSFFTAIVFWMILKWENIADNKYADRWLVLISYMMGLSVGVHLLNLLTIPALAMVYYFKRYKATTTGGIIAFLVGCFFLGLVQFGVLQGIPALSSKFDLIFVNGFGLPFDSGAIFFIVLLCAVMVWLLIFAKRKGWYLLHTGVLCLCFIIIGFSSYIAAIVRSRADVPIDMTNPDNAMSLTSYISREQFGQQPLFFGPDFTSQMTGFDEKGKMYDKSKKDGKDRYDVVGKKLEPKFDNLRFFPRIWDNNDGGHVQFYRQYLGLGPNDEPTSADNYKFFFNYQLNWMWWRYFMWNYAGRQNDVEGQGDPRAGNWVSGFKFFDSHRVGDMDAMGDGFKNNPARNELYFLPFILGILGLVYQFNRNKKDGMVVFLLFFFTGIAVVLFLNNTPLQPRERDYAYAGSTYAYAIWIGLGVLMVDQWLRKAVKNSTASAALTTLLCLLAVPTLMAAKEWDDHDRSRKTWARDSAWNTLNSCAPNAILFTFGDNDTYPVWYLQEIEGVRPDVRIINLSLLGIDWYIDQLNYKINTADAVPMVWKKEDYVGDHHNYIRASQSPQIPQNQYINLMDICKFIVSSDPNNKMQTTGGEGENYFPTKNFYVQSLSKEDLVKNGMVNAADTGHIINEMKFVFSKDVAYKDDIAVLNMVAAIASDGWKRPIYFGGGLPGDNYQGMQDYLKMEGMVYRLVPYKFVDSTNPQQRQDLGFVDADKSFKLFMDTYRWGGGEKNNVYFDEKNKIMFTAYRNNAPRIAAELNKTGRHNDAVALLDKVDKSITQSSYAYNPYLLQGFDPSAYYMVNGYYQIGEKEKGHKVAMQLVANMEADLNWILTLNDDARETMVSDVQRDLGIINLIGNVAKSSGDDKTAKDLEQKVQLLSQKISGKINMQALQQAAQQ
ncbi:glycosyltransferase family 117 protein [Chitinophagaceae bacterium MMS25-I14]